MKDRKIFARGCSKICKIVETYSYEQDISRNPSKEAVERTSGAIEIVMPYDGHQYFPRKAYRDVKKQAIDIKSNRINALIGYLALSNYSNADIRDISEFIDHYDSIPLKVPVRADDIPPTKLLCDDKYAAVISYNYLPAWPEVIPINVDMELFDEDQLSFHDPDQLKDRLSDVTKEITHQANFKRNLLLKMKVKIDLPSKLVPDYLKPRIAYMSITWPTITSFQMLKLAINNQSVPIRYNPVNHCLEWKNIFLDLGTKSSGADLLTYSSPPMLLAIGQPGELYQQIALDARVEIEFSGMLLSGIKARLFNAQGELVEDPKPELTTKLIMGAHMILDDAFARRTFYPCMHLHFDEVIPDEMRLADIKTTLTDRGFEIQFDEGIQLNNPGELRHFILASRSEGPNSMNFWITIEGKRFETERQVQVQGGQTYKSTLESGLMKIYIRGELRGDNLSLTREMNIIQTILHDRFERIRAKR
jgi:hypothetical protein